jgi:predicted transcriptional regulator
VPDSSPTEGGSIKDNSVRISIYNPNGGYHSIYEQIHREGQIPIWKIAQNTGLPRSTISRYLSEMYEQKILVGPGLAFSLF